MAKSVWKRLKRHKPELMNCWTRVLLPQRMQENIPSQKREKNLIYPNWILMNSDLNLKG